jgi:hypothetical protein
LVNSSMLTVTVPSFLESSFGMLKSFCVDN